MGKFRWLIQFGQGVVWFNFSRHQLKGIAELELKYQKNLKKRWMDHMWTRAYFYLLPSMLELEITRHPSFVSSYLVLDAQEYMSVPSLSLTHFFYFCILTNSFFFDLVKFLFPNLDYFITGSKRCTFNTFFFFI